MNRLSICILTAAGIALSGCDDGDTIVRMSPAPDPMEGGGSSSSSGGSSSSFAERARDVTNAESPALTPAQIQQRIERLGSNGNDLFVETSRLHVQTDNENIPDTVIDPDCVGTTCTYTSTDDNLDEFVVALRGAADESERQVILTRNGITTNLIEIEDRLVGVIEGNFRSYGAWLENGSFSVIRETGDLSEGVEASFIYGFLYLGNETGSTPSGDATYQGLMVGSPVGGEHRGNILQGDATLEYALADNEINAQFTEIRDLDRGVAHATESISFAPIGVDEDGVFFSEDSVSPADKYIVGAFAGPDHDEVLGIFESDGIAGTFGAIRQ